MDELFLQLRERVESTNFLKSLINITTNKDFYGALTVERNKEKTRVIVEAEIINSLYAFKKFRVGDLIFF